MHCNNHNNNNNNVIIMYDTCTFFFLFFSFPPLFPFLSDESDWLGYTPQPHSGPASPPGKLVGTYDSYVTGGGRQRSQGNLNWQFHNITVGFVILTSFVFFFQNNKRVMVIYSHAIAMLCYDDDDCE